MGASFCLWTRAVLRAVDTAHGEHTPFLAMDEQHTHALRVGSAGVFAFALAVLRLVLVVRALVFAWVEVRP
jgi:hypothetical protein